MLIKDNKNNQILWLNSIKGVACWIVFFYHFSIDSFYYVPVLSKLTEVSPCFNFIFSGTTALNIFYIISAYLVAGKFLNNKDQFISLGAKGIIKRYLRLSFPILIMNFVIYIIYLLGLGSDRVYDMFTHSYSLWDVFRDAFFDCIFKGSSYFNTVVWMIKDLFYGYLVTILICGIVINLKKTYKSLFLIVTIIIMWLVNCNYATFVFGILLYIVTSSIETKEINKVLWWVGGTCLVTAGLMITSFDDNISLILEKYMPNSSFSSWWNWDWIGAMLIMCGIVISSYIVKMLDNKILAKTGMICMPVFLFHRVCEATIGDYAYRYVLARFGEVSYAIDAAFLSCVICLIVISLVYVFLIEPYVNKLIVFVVKKITL